MISQAGGVRVYRLSNYQTDGTAATAINTGLQLFRMNWWTLDVTFTINSTFTNDYQCVLRCRRDGAPCEGLLVQGDGGSSSARGHLSCGDTYQYGSDEYLPVSTSVTYTLRAEWFNGLGGSQYLSNGSSYKMVPLKGDIDITAPFVIGGSWFNEANPPGWYSGRFTRITVLSLELKYSPLLEYPYKSYSLENYTLNGTSTFIDTGLNLCSPGIREVHIGMRYHYTGTGANDRQTVLECMDESSSQYPGFLVRNSTGSLRYAEFNSSGGDFRLTDSRSSGDNLVFIYHAHSSGNGKNHVYLESNSRTYSGKLSLFNLSQHDWPLTIGGMYNSSGTVARTVTECVIDSLKIMYR